MLKRNAVTLRVTRSAGWPEWNGCSGDVSRYGNGSGKEAPDFSGGTLQPTELPTGDVTTHSHKGLPGQVPQLSCHQPPANYAGTCVARGGRLSVVKSDSKHSGAALACLADFTFLAQTQGGAPPTKASTPAN